MKVLSVDGLSKLITLMKGEFASSSQIPTTTSQLTNNSGFITGISWGDITGTLSSQSDLNTALNNKANDSSVVHLSGDETINGGKTFNQAFIIGTTETHPNEGGQLIFKKSHNSTMAGDVIVDQNVNNLRVIGQSTSLGIIVPFYIDCENNKVYTATPATGDNSTQVATTAFVKAQGYATTSQIPSHDDYPIQNSTNYVTSGGIYNKKYISNSATNNSGNSLLLFGGILGINDTSSGYNTFLGINCGQATSNEAFTSNITNCNMTIIGYSALGKGNYVVAVGYDSMALNTYSIALGYQAKTTAESAIQLGRGTNTESNSFYVGFATSGSNYKLLGSDGKIPDDRLNTTIARTSQIPSASDLLPSQTGNSGKFLTTDGTSASWATVTQPSIATTSTAGLVKPDGTSITVDANGTISAAGGSAYAMVIVDYTAEEE